MNEYRLKNYPDSFFITGFMGTGKSTIGRRLADRLERPFADLDKVIEEKEGRSIKEIFESEGESYFREKEWEYLSEQTKSFKGVLALGGGALHNQHVVDHLKVHGLLIFIETPLEVIVDRVLRNKRRPIVLDAEGKIKSREMLLTELKALYSARINMYQQAQVVIQSNGHENKDMFTAKLLERLSRYV